MKKLALLLAVIMLIVFSACPLQAEEMKELVWGGDSEGGFPYMFPNPQNTDELIGFEVDIVDALAEQMGRKPVYVNNAWENLIPGLNRKLYDI
ncbi:MAG: transporter substrate-binding domain-containing protein, partial [Synergistaceae bacterium]